MSFKLYGIHAQFTFLSHHRIRIHESRFSLTPTNARNINLSFCVGGHTFVLSEVKVALHAINELSTKENSRHLCLRHICDILLTKNSHFHSGASDIFIEK